MSLFEWKECYSVKIPSIDKQHKVLVKWMNAFYVEQQAGNIPQALVALAELVKFTKLHFADEEKLMETLDYDDIVEHKKLHVKLLETVTVFVEIYMADPSTINAESLSNFLKKWLTDHILVSDKKYTSFALKRPDSL